LVNTQKLLEARIIIFDSPRSRKF